ncbi:MAG: hypothetical protein WCT25_01575 [Candidatus Paceibacterota bacterium]
MSIQANVIKEVLYGRAWSIATTADVLYLFDQIKDKVDPKVFQPLIMLTGGFSLVGGEDNLKGLFFFNDWYYLCIDAGAIPKNSVIALAANFDECRGMVALALEGGSIATKPGSTNRLDLGAFAEAVNEVFGRDYAGITAMAGNWGVELKGEMILESVRGRMARKEWRLKLGHDVLIHPVTLKPCEDSLGRPLRF